MSTIKSPRSSCQPNLKQLGLAALQYVQDYDGYYPQRYTTDLNPPGGFWSPTSAPDTAFWPQIIYPYHKSFQAMNCPNGDSNYANNPYKGHYGANPYVLLTPKTGTPLLRNLVRTTPNWYPRP